MVVTTDVSGTTPVGKTFRSEQSVDQGALAALELAEHDEVEPVLRHPGPRCGQMPARCLGQEALGERQQLVERAQPHLSLVQV